MKIIHNLESHEKYLKFNLRCTIIFANSIASNFCSLVLGLMESTRGFEGVQSGVDEVATIKSTCETFWTWEVFCWQVLLLWDLGAVLLICSLINQIFLKSLFGIFNLFSLSWEWSWDHIFPFDLSIIVLDSSVYLCVKFSIFSHFFKSFMFESLH